MRHKRVVQKRFFPVARGSMRLVAVVSLSAHTRAHMRATKRPFPNDALPQSQSADRSENFDDRATPSWDTHLGLRRCDAESRERVEREGADHPGRDGVRHGARNDHPAVVAERPSRWFKLVSGRTGLNAQSHCEPTVSLPCLEPTNGSATSVQHCL